ncbi:MAG TPA: cobyric acid synthase [Candidatus Binatia bacterium]|nr:cobyric acid synthase [Candidatus Binatia bacterium]
MADRTGRTLMLQGTSSSVGKSYLAAGLCRLYARRGLRVAPFKSQNMALNAAVTPGGAEIGRAQAVQAEAAGVPAEPAMNPILLKAEQDHTSQVVLLGEVFGRLSATDYRNARTQLLPHVERALADLRRRFDLVVIEGAGSPAEVNLREGEIVNMRVAEAADAPVLLVGDIDRGGVFAALLGTLDLLCPADRARVQGLVVNRFRGDPALFADGVTFLEERSHLPVLGVVPHLEDARLPAEDSLDLGLLRSGPGPHVLDVAILGLERISNFDELQPLAAEPGVGVRVVTHAADLGTPDLLVLPGSKTTAQDLEDLRERGLADRVIAAREQGAAVLGICGGYQMLGRTIHDPAGVERAGTFPGLGLLPAVTRFEDRKTTVQRRATVAPAPGLLERAAGLAVAGYEIHMGEVSGARPGVLDVEGRPEGCRSEDGWVVGTGLHGLLLDAAFRRALLEAVAARRGRELPPPAPPGPDPFDRIADALTAALDVPRLDRIAGVAPC